MPPRLHSGAAGHRAAAATSSLGRRSAPRPAASAGDCVVWAARAALRGEVAAIVTAPLHKEALAAAGCRLSRATPSCCRPRPRRTWACRVARRAGAHDAGQRRIAHGAGQHPHVAARRDRGGRPSTACCRPCASRIAALCAVLGRAPRIGVAGLNPHAGEGGLFGREERDIIAPAIAAARAEGIDANGPHRARHGVHARPRTPAAGRVRRGGRDVPRPGPDPGQVPGRGARA